MVQLRMDEKDKKLMENCKFSISEIVLCYEPDPIKAKMLYDAKVLDADITKDEKSRKVFEYYIHFQGWNKSWDRWVLENQVLKANETNRTLQTKLYNEAIKQKKRKPKSSRHESGDENDDKSVTSTGSANSDDVKCNQRPLVSLDIPKVLAVRLEDDCYNIKRKKTLIHLPRKPSVNDIFNDYYKHCWKIISTPEGRHMNMNITYEVMQGLNTYFNYYLYTLLLYNFEREQYGSFFSEHLPDLSRERCPVSPNSFSHSDSPAAAAAMKLASPVLSDSSRSNSRTSSFCEDTVSNAASATLLKEVLKTKSHRKRKVEEKSASVDETAPAHEHSTVKRSRNTTSCSSLASPTGSPVRASQQNSKAESVGKSSSRETRSARKIEKEVFPKEEKAIKPMEILEENIIDMTRTTTRSKRYAPKDDTRDMTIRECRKEAKEMKEEERSSSAKDEKKGKNKGQMKGNKESDDEDSCSENTKTESKKENKSAKESEDKKKEKKNDEGQAKISKETVEDTKDDIRLEKGKTEDKKDKQLAEKKEDKKKDKDNVEEKAKLENEIADATKRDVCSEDTNTENKKERKSSKESEGREEEDRNVEEKVKVNKEIAKEVKVNIVLEDTKSESKKESESTKENEDGKKEKSNVSEDLNVENKPAEDAQLDCSLENRKDESCFENSDICSNENSGNRLRRSVRSQKSATVSESDEHEMMPMGSTAKSLQESYKGPLNVSHKALGIHKEANIGSYKSFMIFPLLANGDTPADIYGFEHLLRLFVKLPVLLSSSNIDEPKVVVIMKNVRHFLEYLAKRSDLFVDIATIYSESII